MKARITQKSELSLSLLQSFTFDVLDDNDEVILSSQAIECSPSQLEDEIRQKLSAFETEYQLSQEVEEGTEIS